MFMVRGARHLLKQERPVPLIPRSQGRKQGRFTRFEMLVHLPQGAISPACRHQMLLDRASLTGGESASRTQPLDGEPYEVL